MKLTRDEVRLMVFILSALLLGAGVKQCREAQRAAAPPAATPGPDRAGSGG